MTLGEKIRQLRRQCGLSQEQLAEKMCVSRSAIAKWETDKGLPDIENLKTLSRMLSVSVDVLLDDSEAAEIPTVRETYVLASYGRGCKKVRKDRVIREKFPRARIYTLLGRQEPGKMEPAAPETCSAALGVDRSPDRAFYLVEQDGRQLFVTLTDQFVETRPLAETIHENQFHLDGWHFIKYKYEVQ